MWTEIGAALAVVVSLFTGWTAWRRDKRSGDLSWAQAIEIDNEKLRLRNKSLEDELEKSTKERDRLLEQQSAFIDTLRLGWERERSGLVANLGLEAHAHRQTITALDPLPSLLEWVDQGCPPPPFQIPPRLRAVAAHIKQEETHPRGSE